MPKLKGKVALVTGFGSGLGQAIAVLFAKEGARVAGLSRRLDSGEETLKRIRAAGGEAIFIPTDVRNEAEVNAAVARTVGAFGGLDIVVNSAGIRLTGAATEITKESWDAVIGTNLTGSFLVSRAAVPEMRRRGGGSIINIGAISGIHGGRGRVAYSASKGGVVNLTEAMALDHGRDHIRVNCICPGPTETPMTTVSTPEQRAKMDARVPIGHIGQPEDIAEAALYLASDAAKQVTGAVLAVDGGLHLAE
jgi:NAD(P)-dependent dehydrogenase (short-subunit alcohol dehydrogenase family)